MAKIKFIDSPGLIIEEGKNKAHLNNVINCIKNSLVESQKKKRENKYDSFFYKRRSN